ncbi:MAG: helix-turn-helix domain-containing protein [Actinomycetota bacterium]|nr:helix-turn-helix domain-containing protein [Actinomycetota bacterium]
MKEMARPSNQNHEERLAFDLVSMSDETDMDSINIMSQLLSFDISRPLATMVIDWSGFRREDNLGPKEEKLLASISAFFGQTNHLSARMGGGGAFVIKSLQISDASVSDPFDRHILRSGEIVGELIEVGGALFEYLKTKDKVETSIGIGNYYSATDSARRSFKEAVLALKIGRSRGMISGIFHAKDNSLTNLLASIDFTERENYCAGVLGAIEGEGELIRTLDVFFEADLNITTASRMLFAHRNTLIYRLGKIYDLTGLDPKSFKDAAVLCAALKLCQLSRENLG